MSAIFSAEELRQMSSDSILDEYEKRRSRFRDYEWRRRNDRGRLSSFSPRQLTTLRSAMELEVYSNTFLELLLFCSTMVLWMSGIVMLGFGFYLVFSQSGWAVVTESKMYWLGMMLQMASALSVLIAAGITTTLLSPDMETPKRALVALGSVIVSPILLLSEIIVCSVSKSNQVHKSDTFYTSILNNSDHKALNEQDLVKARKKGFECKNWENQHCNKLYIKPAEIYINFLIGSASVTLALIIIVIPILILVYRTTVHKITRVRPTTEYSNHTIQANRNPSILEHLDD